jgi:ethanolamine ammonia-lyase large subunit
LKELGVVAEDGGPAGNADAVSSLYAEYFKEGGDARGVQELQTEAMRKLRLLQERGWDLGLGHEDYCAPAAVRSRMEAIYKQARLALYSHMEESVISRASLNPIRVRTLASSREEFLSHPSSGERVREKDESRLYSMYPVSRPRIQFVISDGLNANAVNLSLGTLLPDLRKQLAQSACRVGEIEVFVDNGRVRAGYHIGQILNADVVIHLIGERPGTGLDTLSAYLTYGRDAKGASRWSPELDHSCTTAVCGIHPRAKSPHAAASEIARLVRTMLDQKTSGVALTPGKHNT